MKFRQCTENLNVDFYSLRLHRGFKSDGNQHQQLKDLLQYRSQREDHTTRDETAVLLCHTLVDLIAVVVVAVDVVVAVEDIVVVNF